jgi:hypothetical protein
MTDIYAIVTVLGIAFMLSITSTPIFVCWAAGGVLRPPSANGPRPGRRVSRASGAAVFFAVTGDYLGHDSSRFRSRSRCC